MSICALHGEHVHAVTEMQKHPRADGKDLEFQKKLVLALAPIFTSWALRGAPTIDADTTAQKLFDHVDQIQRRLD